MAHLRVTKPYSQQFLEEQKAKHAVTRKDEAADEWWGPILPWDFEALSSDAAQ